MTKLLIASFLVVSAFALDASAQVKGPAAGGTCQITAGQLVTTSLNVAKQPAAPEISVTYQNCNPGLLQIDAYFLSSSTPVQRLETSFNLGSVKAPPSTQGTIKFKQIGSQYGFGQFNPYSAAGTWTLTDIYIRDLATVYTHYDQAALTPLFNTLTLNLTNNGKPDTTAPLITSGELLTPTVSINSHPYFFANLGLSDDVSGVVSAYVAVRPPGNGSPVTYYKYLPLPLKKGTVKAFDYLGKQTVTGTWTIYSVFACDVAHNCTYITSPTDIQNLFGTTTFELVN